MRIGRVKPRPVRSHENEALERPTPHSRFCVSDFEQSVEWYTNKLGFREMVRWTVDGLPGTNLAYLKRGGFLLEIASGPTTEATVSLPSATDFGSHFAQRGFTHLCFRVRDVDAALAELNAKGVPTFSPAIDFPALNTRVGFIQDPDGNVIELKGPMAGDNVVEGRAQWVD
ncbi:MAG: VOC family protein [Planctomycetota bacterium]